MTEAQTLLQFLALATVMLVVLLATVSWLGGGPDTQQRLLRVLIWAMTLSSSALVALSRLGFVRLSNQLLTAGGLLLGLIFVIVIAWGIGRAGPRWGAIEIVAWLYVVLMAVSLLANGSPLNIDTVPVVAALTYLPGLAVLTRQSGATFEQVCRTVAGATTVVTYVSLAACLVFPDLAYAHRSGDERRIQVLGLVERASGLTPHPNLIAITAAIAAILAFGLRLRTWPITAAAALAMIGLAESRVAFASLVGALALGVVLRGSNRTLRFLLITPMYALGLYLFAPWYAESAATLTSDVDSLNGRRPIWDLVLDTWQQRDILGFGPLAFSQWGDSPFSRTPYSHAHNQFLQGLAEGGVFGLLLMVALVLALLRVAWRNRHGWIVPALTVPIVLQLGTETFFSAHIFGYNFAAIPALLLTVVFVSADSRREVGHGLPRSGAAAGHAHPAWGARGRRGDVPADVSAQPRSR